MPFLPSRWSQDLRRPKADWSSSDDNVNDNVCGGFNDYVYGDFYDNVNDDEEDELPLPFRLAPSSKSWLLETIFTIIIIIMMFMMFILGFGSVSSFSSCPSPSLKYKIGYGRFNQKEDFISIHKGARDEYEQYDPCAWAKLTASMSP